MDDNHQSDTTKSSSLAQTDNAQTPNSSVYAEVKVIDDLLRLSLGLFGIALLCIVLRHLYIVELAVIAICSVCAPLTVLQLALLPSSLPRAEKQNCYKKGILAIFIMAAPIFFVSLLLLRMTPFVYAAFILTLVIAWIMGRIRKRAQTKTPLKVWVITVCGIASGLLCVMLFLAYSFIRQQNTSYPQEFSIEAGTAFAMTLFLVPLSALGNIAAIWLNSKYKDNIWIFPLLLLFLCFVCVVFLFANGM